MNKNQFIQILQQELAKLGPAAVSEILADFEEHFTNGLARGKTESEISAELGDPYEIARQYIDGTAEGLPVQPVGSSGRYQWSGHEPVAGASINEPPREWAEGDRQTDRNLPKQSSEKHLNETALIFVLVFNLLVGIPVWIGLFSILFGLWVAAGGVGVAACVLFTVAVLRVGITSLILALFGLSMAALLILAVILMVHATKWLIIGLCHYVRWNKKLIVGGGLA